MPDSGARSAESVNQVRDANNPILSDCCAPASDEAIVVPVTSTRAHNDHGFDEGAQRAEKLTANTFDRDNSPSDSCSSNPKKRNLGSSSDAGSSLAGPEAIEESRSDFVFADSVEIATTPTNFTPQATLVPNNHTLNISLPPSKKRRVDNLRPRSPRAEESHHNRERHQSTEVRSPTTSRTASQVSSRTTSYTRSVRFENTPLSGIIPEFASEDSDDRENNPRTITQAVDSNAYDSTTNESLTSPLFFSKSPQSKLDEIIAHSGGGSGAALGLQPVLPRLSSGVAGQRMLSKAQDGEEESSFRIVTLPRGNFNELGVVGGTMRGSGSPSAMARVEGENGSASGSSAAKPQTPGGQSGVMGTTPSVGASVMSRSSSEKLAGWSRSPGEVFTCEANMIMTDMRRNRIESNQYGYYLKLESLNC
jgi:hypothetical protein